MKNLEPFFNPKSILIIGVSRKAYTFSYTILKNLLEIFYQGKLWILNPNAEDILGIKAYHSFEDLPEVPELAVVVLGKNILEIVENLGKLGVKNITIQAEVKIGRHEIPRRDEPWPRGERGRTTHDRHRREGRCHKRSYGIAGVRRTPDHSDL